MKHIRLYETVDYPAAYEIGERVYFSYCGVKIPAVVRVVLHTEGKVRYSLVLCGCGDLENNSEYFTSAHNIDSTFVESYPDKDGKKVVVEMDFDNYS